MKQLSVALLVVAVAGLAACGGDDDTSDAADVPSGVETFDVTSRQHVEGDLDYPQAPPVGGDHNPAWQNCGVYREPVEDENAVHSLEHGAVWITYDPTLAADAVAALESRAEGQTHVLVTPVAGLDSPIVLSAWGAQARVDSPDDPRIDEFVRAFQEGPGTPEPGAPCSGGLGTTEMD